MVQSGVNWVANHGVRGVKGTLAGGTRVGLVVLRPLDAVTVEGIGYIWGAECGVSMGWGFERWDS